MSQSRDTSEAAIPAEVELKFLIAAAHDLHAISRLHALGQYRLRRRRTQRLHSVYVDTAEQSLARNGVALRLRRDTVNWEATAKWEGRVDGALHERPELTVSLGTEPALPFSLTPGLLRTHLAALVGGRPLQPLLITDIYRRRFDILGAADDDQTPVAELALDTVRLRPPAGNTAIATYHELEIELRGGTRRDLRTIGQSLKQQFNLTPSASSKFARGLSLLYSSDLLGASQTPAVHAHDSIEAATRKILAAQLQRVRQHDPGTREGRDPEALHDMRVAVRRLRAAIRMFAGAMSTSLHATLTAELKWLGQTLGDVRDLDVQLANLAKHGSSVSPAYRDGLEPFRRYMESERTRRRLQLLVVLDSSRYFHLLTQLERYTRPQSRPRFQSPAAQASISATGRPTLKRAFRRLIERGEAVEAAPQPGDLHALRIRAKRLRYLLEFLREITGEPGRRLVKQLVQLQDALGAFNDAQVAASFIRTYRQGPGVRSDPATGHHLTELGLAELAESELRRADAAREAFLDAWRRFADKRTLREYRGVVQILKTSSTGNE